MRICLLQWTKCCENMLITCFALCLETWDVIWEMRFRFVLCLKLFEMIRSRDHAWSSHRLFFWSSNLVFDEWRMLILDYRVTYVCSRFVERRMFILDLSNDVYDETSLMRHLIKLEKSDSSNLTKTTHQTWRKQRHLIKFDDSVISSNLRSSSHQTFEKTNDFSTFDERSCSDTWYEKLSLAEDHFCCVRLLW
jgi:hypothetical protein